MENIEDIKVEIEDMSKRMDERKFKSLTVGILRKLGIQPFDLIDINKTFPQLKESVFKFTWEIMIPIHNECSNDGVKITDDTTFRIAMENLIALVSKGFLV